jgi:hypothetical protein
MQGQDNIISFSGGSFRRSALTLDAKAQRTVGECRDIISSTLPKLMVELFEQLDDSLYELADKSLNNALQSSYFDGMRVLRKERLRIDTEFTQQVLVVFDHFWETGHVETTKHSLSELNQDSEMELLDNEELEDSLAVTNMVSKSENRYARERFALTQRFFYLISGGQQDSASVAEASPLEPAVICNAFQAAMRDVGIELPVKLIVYKHFEKHVTHYLGGLYDEINLVLSKAGIIPRLTQKIRRNPIAPSVQSGRVNTPSGHSDSHLTSGSTPVERFSSTVSDAVEDEIFSVLQQLLTMRRVSTADSMLASSMLTTGGSSASLPTVDKRELLGALSALQQSNVLVLPQAGGQSVNPNHLRARLAEDLHLRESGDASRMLGDADNDTIDVVSMLFEFILDDSTLPDAMKALLSRLQIPMLKVAILDKGFFSTKGHPARHLLNNMAQAAIVWNENGERDSDSLYHKIESIIKRITNEFHDDSAVFVELDQEFSVWWEQEQRGAEVAEQRTNQVTRGKEQLRNAKQIVVNELNRRLHKLDTVPEAVMEILEDGWKDVLLLNYLRQGSESEEWAGSLAIVDRLLWSVLPKTEYKERQELLRGIPELLRNLRERLNSISFDQHKMARLFKELQNCHIACLRGNDIKNIKGPGTSPSRSKQISFPDSQLMANGGSYLVDEHSDLQASRPDRFTRLAENLEVGSWLEIKDEDTRSRIKLSWKSNVTDAYIFVNRKGLKAMEMTQQGLAMRLREGSAKIVDLPTAPIMDRALDAMLTALKNTDQTTSPA